MKAVLLSSTLLILWATLVFSQTLSCHRCFGNTYCNDANHTDFNDNVANATCDLSNAIGIEALNHPFWSQIQEAVNKDNLLVNGQVAPHNTLEANCITATVFEPHDTHTLRSCILRTVPADSNTTLCELLGSIVQTQNAHNGTFSCSQCNGTHFCNTHTLTLNDGEGDGSGEEGGDGSGEEGGDGSGEEGGDGSGSSLVTAGSMVVVLVLAGFSHILS